MEQDPAQTLLPGVSVDDLSAVPPACSSEAPPRLRRADRAQVLLRPCSLEELLGHDHPARTVWAVVERWDLSAFLAGVLSRGEAPGRAATDLIFPTKNGRASVRCQFCFASNASGLT